MSRSLVVLILLASAVPTSAVPRRRASSPSLFPPCSVVNGSPAVTFSRDAGHSVAATTQKLSGIAYTFGLAALDATTLLSMHNTTLAISHDAGCNWTAIGDVAFIDSSLAKITAASATRAYIWSDNRSSLARYSNGAIKILKPPVDIVGVGVDRTSADHLRIGGSDGSLWESSDGGESWSKLASSPVTNAIVYRAAFDPANLNHVLFGFSTSAAFVTFDGGRTFTQSHGFGNQANVFSIAVSPADPNTVWAEGLNLAESDPQNRHIYLSRDGGANFTPVIDASANITLINGTLIVPHPTDANVLYFVFGTFFDAYGTDLFRFDASTKTLITNHFTFDDIDAIAFSPVDPNVMYFGLEVVQRNQP